MTASPDSAESQGPEQRRMQELAALYAVSAAMNQATSEEQALAQALSRVLQVLHLESGRIYLLQNDESTLALAASVGNPSFLDQTEQIITPGECLCGMAFSSGEPIVSGDLAGDARVSRFGCRQHTGHACAAVPLVAKERMLGVLHVAGRQDAALTSTDLALLRSVGAQIGVATENMRLREDARRAEALTVLLAEMHHRIKNNLQTVADLLSLEMLSSTSSEARQSLQASIRRIKTIAAVHQLLSVEQVRLTDIAALARKVAELSLQHMLHPSHNLTVEVRGPTIYLPSKQATALALILNELISNALQHAFANARPGKIFVELQQTDGQIILSVTDDGTGLPPGFDLNIHSGLGLQIVRTLAEKDLAGNLCFERQPAGGNCARLTFYR